MPAILNKFLEEKVNRFYKNNGLFKPIIEKMLNNMMNLCTYKNGESIERHNFGNKPVELKNIPQELNSPDFEKKLLEALQLEENQKSIIELLWGDIQLGKRIQACIIMWISVHILKRPVIYIFRNLKIDHNQLGDSIRNCDSKYDFQIKYIRKYFDDAMSENIEEDDWKMFKLPELKDLGRNGEENENLKKLSSKDSINPSDIFCCLMNHKQLEKINNKLNEYIHSNNELMNITLLVDESDLYAPTSSNNEEHKNDLKDSTLCEKLLAKIYKKIRYVLHITGTAHSLLYNVTTKLSNNNSIQIPISKVHKMKRTKDYYGLFNNKIKFDTNDVKEWWENTDSTKEKKKYTLQEDYTENIKPIIKKIVNRNHNKYNSLLISEEKIRIKHFELAYKIIEDYKNLFIIVFHGNCLRLYISKQYEKELKYYSQKDKRLYKQGGIYGLSIDKYNSKNFPNNYCYFDINSKKYNLKQIYKLLAMMFKDKKIKVRTIITITGKYGERGYSFTSDNYDEYQLHLTDQYFPCHVKNKNCTDISQRLRLQGKYKDNPELILWTSNTLKDIMETFFIPLMKEIEKNIMKCNNWKEIKDLIEGIIGEQGNINFEYMKYIDVRKKCKSWKLNKHYEKNYNGFRLYKINDMTEENIKKWCINNKLPNYVCINNIKKAESKNKFIEEFGDCNIKLKKEYIDIQNDNNIKKTINKMIKDIKTEDNKDINISEDWFKERIEMKIGNKYKDIIRGKKNIYTIQNIEDNKNEGLNDNNHRANLCYDEEKLLLCIRYKINKKVLPKKSTDIKKILYDEDKNGNIKYSIIKEQYKNKNNTKYDFPKKYYFITPDNWLFLYDETKNKKSIVSLKILEPNNNNNNQNNDNFNTEISEFIKTHIKDTEQKNLRVGICEIMNVYDKWCNKKKIKHKKRTQFKVSFENIGRFKEEKSKGIDLKGKSGKRGYNLDFK
jgi:hypothetical protein